jgi:hypothetical protein
MGRGCWSWTCTVFPGHPPTGPRGTVSARKRAQARWRRKKTGSLLSSLPEQLPGAKQARISRASAACAILAGSGGSGCRSRDEDRYDSAGDFDLAVWRCPKRVGEYTVALVTYGVCAHRSRGPIGRTNVTLLSLPVHAGATLQARMSRSNMCLRRRRPMHSTKANRLPAAQGRPH